MCVCVCVCVCVWDEMKVKRLTSCNKEDEFGVSTYLLVLRQRSVNNKLTVVVACVVDPQLRDAHVQGVDAGVTTGADAAQVFILVHSGRAVRVHEEHLALLGPAAAQVHAEGGGLVLLNDTRKNHGVALTPLQELNVTEHWRERNTERC